MANEISAKQVKELRDKTAAGMMDCKKALAEAGGDLEKAIEWLREKGVVKAKKREGRTANQGIVDSYLHTGGQIGAIIELNCETDFVARNADFIELAHQVLLHIAAMNPLYLAREDVPEEVVESEKKIYETRCKEEGKPEKIWDKITEGMLNKFYQDVCLLEQPFVKEPEVTIGQLVTATGAKVGEKVEIRRFARWQVGEELS